MTHCRIAYVVNHAAFFVSHRLPLAIEARSAGFDVALFTGQPGSHEMEKVAVAILKEEGVAHQRVAFSSSGLNPVRELVGLLQLVWQLHRFKPQLVHCASPKGVLYGGIAARVCGVRGLVLAISGMGYAYTKGQRDGVFRRFVRFIADALAGVAFRHPNLRVIVQNSDDYAFVLNNGLVDESQLTLIPGSGVNLDLFANCSAHRKSQSILLPARMLKDKGVYEFVEAARKVKASEPDWHFILAGAAGYDNPSAIDEKELRGWQEEGIVEWRGHVVDMTPLFDEAAIVCLPSYREGLPKALLEAAAACCAVVTTDVTGCREAIDPGVTGDLVAARDSDELARALLSLIQDDCRRHRYGINGRERAVRLFSIEAVASKCVDIYKGLAHVSK